MSNPHCWKGFTDEDGESYTCLLDCGHEGNHQPTPDSEIKIQFAGEQETKSEKC